MPEENNQNSAPSNLPIGDIPVAAPASNEPVDILNEVDAAPVETKVPTNAPSLGQTPSVPPAMRPPEKSVSKEPVFSQKRKVIAGVLGIIVLGVLGVAGWYGYNLFFSGDSVSSEPVVNNQNNTTPEPVAPEPVAPEPVVPDPEPEVSTLDSDKDGLTDVEEALYGTDPFKVDTDLDSLTDRDEILVFKTDPNNPDSDGDTFLDGAEVRSGFDPKGPGKLLELN